jgi:DNA-directed RNA polymerase subunit N (RpoN/RPB10)
MATRCFTCKAVISNRYERYKKLMEEYADQPDRRLRVFRELKATRECCQTRLVTYFDQESMLLSVPTHMFASAAPPYSRPNPEAQALVLEARIAQAEARMAKTRSKRTTAASSASSSFFDPDLMQEGEVNGDAAHTGSKRKRSGGAAGTQPGAPAKRGRPRNDSSSTASSAKSKTKKIVRGAVGRPRTKPPPPATAGTTSDAALAASTAAANAPAAARVPRKYNKRSKVSSAIEKEVRAIMEGCDDVLVSSKHSDRREQQQQEPSKAKSTIPAVLATSSTGKAKQKKSQSKMVERTPEKRSKKTTGRPREEEKDAAEA